MKFIFILVTILSVGYSCKRNEDNSCSGCSEKKIPLQLIKGKEFPDGAGCFFSFDSVALARRAYVFVSDYNETGLMNIEGEDIFVKQTKPDSEQTDNIQSIYENDVYEIQVIISEPYDSLDYTFYYTGTITLKNKSTGERFVHPVYSECGC